MISLEDILNNKEPIKKLEDLFNRKDYQLILYDMEAILYLTFEIYQRNNPYSEVNTKIEKYFEGFKKELKKTLNRNTDNKDINQTCYKIAVFGSEKNFRKNIDPNYKANRNESIPYKLKLKRLGKVFNNLNILISKAPEGYEADDWIASICRKLHNKTSNINIVTTDSDLLQLVNKNIKVILLKLDNNKITNSNYQIDNFNYFGLKPNQIAQIKALCGDSSDNINGALTYKEGNNLIRRYGSINEIYRNINEIDDKSIKLKLTFNKEHITHNLELTSLKDNLIN